MLAVLGVGGYVLSQPTKDTVEYHTRQYLRYGKGTWRQRGQETILDYYILRRKRTRTVYEHPNQEVHRRALINLRYLAETQVVLVHKTFEDVVWEAKHAVRHQRKVQAYEFLHVEAPSTNVVRVVAKPEDIPIFLEELSNIDLPDPPEK